LDDRTLKIAIVLIGHVMWLSTAAIRILRGERALGLRGRGGRLVQLYQYLVWIPLVLATFFASGQADLAAEWRIAGVAIALVSSLLAAWAMWTAPRSRYPGIVGYHVGAALALESVALVVATAALVVPYTLARIAAERRVA
jgi:cobalamin synthase